jgi:predicted lipoprotein with Yx(FWY)xxD motif
MHALKLKMRAEIGIAVFSAFSSHYASAPGLWPWPGWCFRPACPRSAYWQTLNNQANKKTAVKFMSISHKLVLLFLAASILFLPAMAAGNYTVNVTADKFLGNYLTNQSGFTLYYFSDDGSKMDTSSCYEDCAARWPPFYAEMITVPDSLRTSDFSTITRTDGSKQTTFKGWPLYFSSRDKEAGDMFGNGQEDNLWHIINPDDQPQLI